MTHPALWGEDRGLGGWGREAPAHRSVSRQMTILEQGCQGLHTSQTSFPSTSHLSALSCRSKN